MAYRDLSEEQWEEWSERFRDADKATDCRDDRLAAAYEEIEQDMMVCLCPIPLFCVLSLFVNNINYLIFAIVVGCHGYRGQTSRGGP